MDRKGTKETMQDTNRNHEGLKAKKILNPNKRRSPLLSTCIIALSSGPRASELAEGAQSIG